MTVIEFYDKASIENIAGALLCESEKVILIGDKKKHLEAAIDIYKDILEKNGIKTEFSYKTVTKNNLQSIISLLAEIVEGNDDCVFDLTGGEDLYLVAVGVIMERYGTRVKCHRFNFKSDKAVDCDSDGKVCCLKSLNLSVEDNINIYGGEIITDPQKEIFTYPWDFNEDFLRDIEIMWSICRKNVRLWNLHIATLGSVCKLHQTGESLALSYKMADTAASLKQRKVKYFYDGEIMRELEKNGLISSLSVSDTISFLFKNNQVKQCLTVAGQILELVVAKTMRSLKDTDGTPLYDDVRVGVVMDWDRAEEEEEYRTLNEIDVMAMKGAIPIFISCKNGDFDANELYKLSAVAERFGDKYAKKVLISTKLDELGGKGEYIRARMEDMTVRSIENADEMDAAEFERVLKSLWIN